MHDPMTVAWRIKRPWPQLTRFPNGQRWRYWPSVITIWHVDPCLHGDEKSCGWAFPRLTPTHLALIDELVREDMAFPYFSSRAVQASGVVVNPSYLFYELPPGDCFGLVYAAWLNLAWRFECRRLTPRDIIAIGNLALCHNDNLRASLVDGNEQPAELVRRFLCAVFANYLRFRRRWYRHPRWHMRHWKVQIEPLLQLKRWLWSRCMVCGTRFRYGESPVSEQWDGEGPRWFRGEPLVYHTRCSPHGQPVDVPQEVDR